MPKLLYLLMLLGWSVSAEVLELSWLDLVPDDEVDQVMATVNQQQLGMHDESLPANNEQSFVGSVREELNNQQVKIPGFVIPIEGTSMAVKEFLLVPFYGACIHVPPPPQNQIVHVVMDDYVPIKGMWEVVNVTGTLRTQTFDHDLAMVGYQLEGEVMTSYK
ncbi:DUF3299 domain-containing protein [Aliagarivorans marinus]|uniref:DUF3299 domain-containing protein n=1 Tax=Aliagarivorans marinus TaxID=561965 RepID=UPI0003FEBE48|nr:DUF3299 domain-containing protein [Aliagarivorans marinus]